MTGSASSDDTRRRSTVSESRDCAFCGGSRDAHTMIDGRLVCSRSRMVLGDDRVVLVGEHNPYGADPDMALVNYPQGCAGYNLWRILGLAEVRYLELARVNLCAGAWHRANAVAAAGRLYSDLPDPAPGIPTLVVLLGARVADAFRGITIPRRVGPRAAGALPEWWVGDDAAGRATWIRIPHPSGLCRSWGAGMWRPGGSVDRARGMLTLEAPRVPWGEVHPLREAGDGR